MRGRDGPTGRAKFVNTNFLRQMRQEHVYKIIIVFMKFGVTISVESSDSISKVFKENLCLMQGS